MTITRRGFAATSIAALALGGWARLGSAQAGDTYRNEVPGYGPLKADPAGYFDLPEGFSYRVLAKAGEVMDDGFIAPDNFDGMGCFALADGKLALVRNHELSLGSEAKGPAGTDVVLEARLAAATPFDRGQGGRVLPGGTTTLVLDPKGEKVLRQHLSLAGTSTNCAGGVTPWGSWLTCEETVVAAPRTGTSHGWVFEVPAAATGLVAPVPLKAMGRFRHEAAAVDPRTGIIYQTEDQDDGLFYRFIPKVPGKLAEGGRLQALAFVDGHRDSRNWNGADFAPRTARAVRWIDLADVENPKGDLRLRGHAAGGVRFARGEGIHLGRRPRGGVEFFFTCTSGGPGRYGQIMRYVPSPVEGRPGEAKRPGRLELFHESTDPQLMDYADNLTVAPWGHLIVCEDRTGSKINHLRGVTPDGRTYTLARLNADTELAGACFSPDGKTLFVNAYAPGRTLAITGPWDALHAS
jgi:secreted PhoX family phosphatase